MIYTLYIWKKNERNKIYTFCNLQKKTNTRISQKFLVWEKNKRNMILNVCVLTEKTTEKKRYYVKKNNQKTNIQKL